jgi:tetratricopeptide (TPR) repeat protein
MGYVVSEPIGRESYYELREPLMRLCLEVKKQRQEPVRLFVDFLRVWWTKGELETRLLLLTNQKGIDKEYLLSALEALQGDSHDPRVTACEKDFSQYFDKGDFVHALSVAEEMVALQGRPHDLSRQALCLSRLDRDAEALTLLDKVIAVEPNDAVAQFARATVLMGLERWEEAEKASSEAVRLRPSFDMIWSQRAQILMRLGRRDEALEAWKRVTDLDQTNATAWLRRAMLESALQNIDEARVAAEKAVKLDPKSGDAWLMKGLVTVAKRDWVSAIDAFEKAHQFNDEPRLSLFLKLVPLAQLGRWDELLPALKFAVRSLPSGVSPKPQIELLLSTVGDMLILEMAHGKMPQEVFGEFLRFCSKTAGLAIPIAWLLRTLAKYAKIKPEDMRLWEQFLSTIESGDEGDRAKRLLEAGMEYRKTGDAKALLELPVEERRILSDLFHPAKGHSADVPDDDKEPRKLRKRRNRLRRS